MTSMYKITNYVLDEIYLTSSFNFFSTSATISNSNLDKKELHQRSYIPMIVKRSLENGIRGQKQKG
jgi:hypothetical protein